MAQDQPPETPGHATPQRNSAGTAPNMLPQDTNMAGASSSLPSLSFLPPNSQYQDPRSSYAPYSQLGFSFLDQYAGFSSPQALPTGSFNIPARHHREPPASTFNSAIRRSSASVNRSMTSAGLPGPPGQKRSRLPSVDVGRKVPRKSSSSSPQPSRTKSSSMFKLGPKPGKQQNATEGHRRDSVQQSGRQYNETGEHRRDSAQQPQRKLFPKNSATEQTSTPKLRTSRSIARPNPSTPARTRRVAAEHDDDADYVELSVPTPSLEAGLSNQGHVSPTSTRTTRSNPNMLQAHVRPNRPRPKYDYTVPKELEEVCRALGGDNWNDYLILTEDRCLDMICDDEFAVGSKKIFSVYDEATRRKMERLVTSKVVMPVLQAGNEELQLQGNVGTAE